MKIAVIGGTGLIGSQVVTILNATGHEAVPLSPSTGVDLLSGQGLAEALEGADVVVNLTNSPTFDDASPAFFEKTMDNLLAAAEAAGVGHAVILSIVAADVSAGAPLPGTRDVAGPEVFSLDELGKITLAARGGHRTVITDNSAGMFAAAAGDALIAKDGAVIATTTYRSGWRADPAGLARHRPGEPLRPGCLLGQRRCQPRSLAGFSTTHRMAALASITVTPVTAMACPARRSASPGWPLTDSTVTSASGCQPSKTMTKRAAFSAPWTGLVTVGISSPPSHTAKAPASRTARTAPMSPCWQAAASLRTTSC